MADDGDEDIVLSSLGCFLIHFLIHFLMRFPCACQPLLVHSVNKAIASRHKHPRLPTKLLHVFDFFPEVSMKTSTPG